MKLDDFEVHVNVDGAALPEYNTQRDQDGKTVTCWIPSDAGKSFTVSWKSLIAKPYDVASSLNIDGSSVGRYWERANSTSIVLHTALRTSSTTERPFVFSYIDMTDDDMYYNNENFKKIGNITLAIWEVVVGEKTDRRIILALPDEKVHERSKKAMVHRVKLGEVQENPIQQVWKTKSIRELASFVFRYRSIDILRAEGIAPPDPAAKKRKSSEFDGHDGVDEEEEEPGNSNEEADEAELKALLEKVNVIQSKLAKNGSKLLSKKKKVKTETRSVFVPGEVIDLT